MTQTLITREALERRIGEALLDFGVHPEGRRPDARWDEIDVDSLDLVELAQIIDEEYGVKLTLEDLNALTTVGDAVDLICARLGG